MQLSRIIQWMAMAKEIIQKIFKKNHGIIKWISNRGLLL